MAILPRHIFREYDIRGEVNEKELNEKSLSFIGKAFGTMLKKRRINKCIVGYDSRSYSKAFGRAVEKTLNSAGISTVNIGMVTTGMAYFAQHYFKIKGIAMITASHNPNGWSGLKLGCDYSSTLVIEGMQELYDLILSEKFAVGKGTPKKADINDAYDKDLLERFSFKNPMRVVVNGRNNIGGKILSRILKKAGHNVAELYCDIDFLAPHGDANPSLNPMMEETGKLVLEKGAEIGLAIDADGDRLGATDENGANIYSDKLVVLLVRDVLKKCPGSGIVYDVKCTRALEEDITANGGKPVMWWTGHSHVKMKAFEIGAAFAGERSGHMFFFKDFYGFDDACFAALKLLDYIQRQGKTLSELYETIPKYYSSPVYHAYCADTVKYDVMERITEKFKKKFGRVNDINGARVEFEDGWGLTRCSSNLPDMVLVFEAETPKRLEEIEQLFRKELKEFPEISSNWLIG